MRRFIWTLALAVLAGGGVLAGVSSATTSAPQASHAKKVTISVVANEWSFKLSKTSVPVGTTVIFKVTNKGKIGHDFKIAGKKTKILNPGKSQSITVKFAKKGSFAYVCDVTGHAALGMKGTFGVGVSGGGGSTGGGTGGTTTTPTTTTTASNVGSANTTVNVNMVDYQFQLTVNGQPVTSLPSGHVTFVIKNSGNDVHNFDLNGVKAGAILSPGQTETWTVALAPGQYLYTCDVPFHVDRGMTGALTVTS